MSILIIGIIVIIPLLVMAVFLLQGKGAFLIAGYNTMGKERRAQYDKKALCRFTGKLLIVICVCFAVTFIGSHLEAAWLTVLGIALILVVITIGMIYANTGGRFKLKDAVFVPDSSKGKRKAVIIISCAVVALVTVGLVVMIVAAEREPQVDIGADSLRIRALYGLRVDFAEIESIELLDQSMRQIGIGRRTNGYNGGALRGHFTSGLLFVRPHSSPTLRITRHNASDIFISFADASLTYALYGELTAAVR